MRPQRRDSQYYSAFNTYKASYQKIGERSLFPGYTQVIIAVSFEVAVVEARKYLKKGFELQSVTLAEQGIALTLADSQTEATE